VDEPGDLGPPSYSATPMHEPSPLVVRTAPLVVTSYSAMPTFFFSVGISVLPPVVLPSYTFII